MKRAGVIGLGNMGSGLALNLIKNGFDTAGYDLLAERMEAFTAFGGNARGSVAEVGALSDVVFVMVMTGEEVRTVVLGDEGLVSHMPTGGTIVLSATIKPAEARQLAIDLQGSGIGLIDSPVSGGYPGAQGGTLTLMAAGPADVVDACIPVLEAVSETIHRVGTEPGEGQTVKACLQSLIGAMFSATFEAAVLAAKAGVPGDVIHQVFSTSSAGCGIVNNSLEKIIDRKFTDTGSHISTMHKDLTISLDLAAQLGVPMHTAATAMQLFHAGKTRYPEGDNWIITRILEEIVGAELHH